MFWLEKRDISLVPVKNHLKPIDIWSSLPQVKFWWVTWQGECFQHTFPKGHPF